MDIDAHTFSNFSTNFLNRRKCVLAASKRAVSSFASRIRFSRVLSTTTAYRLAIALGLFAKNTT